MDRQLNRLRRDELLEILLEVEQENEQLTDQNLQLKQQLANKEIAIQKAGSLAEASIQLSGVFAAAQEAVDFYVQNTKRLCLERAQKTDELCRGARMSAGDTVDGSDQTSLEDLVRDLFDDPIVQGDDAS